MEILYTLQLWPVKHLISIYETWFVSTYNNNFHTNLKNPTLHIQSACKYM